MSTPNQPAKPAAVQPGDAKLISAARRGDSEAFEMLLSRHQEAAMRLARRLAPNAAAEVYDVAVEAVQASLRAGTGPRAAFRAYLLTAVRRANYDRAKAAGKVRPIDELAANKVLLIASSSVSAELLGQTTLAYRQLSEVQQLALWHTEVDGEPFLDTGLMLGISGTEVAELAFGARDELRRAMIGTQMDAAAAGPCKWTCDRLGAHVRRRLTPTIAEKVRSHLEHCSTCRELVPAVTAMEAEMQALIAMVVLGAAAGPYLDMDSVSAKGRKAAVVVSGDDEAVAAAGFFSGRRKAAFAGVGAIIAAAGLFGGLSMANNAGTENTASGDRIKPNQLPTMLDDFEAGPEEPVAAGSGSAGSAIAGPKHAKPSTIEDELSRPAVTRGYPKHAAPKHAKPATSQENGEPADAAAKKPAASQKPTEKPAEKPADNDVQTLALGPLGDLEITPAGGLLGVLPGVELTPPAAS